MASVREKRVFIKKYNKLREEDNTERVSGIEFRELKKKKNLREKELPFGGSSKQSELQGLVKRLEKSSGQSDSDGDCSYIC